MSIYFDCVTNALSLYGTYQNKLSESIMNYAEFLETKKLKPVFSGFEVSEQNLNEWLFDFQRYIVVKACRAGKYAIFADCGLGKTLMQLEWARLVSEYTGMPVLILCPLAVAGQTIKEGEKFGIPVERLNTKALGRGVFITNYDQLPNIDASQFAGIVLDESSILKNFTGKMKREIISAFKFTPYKLACSATPSPNDLNEIGNHSEFLDIMEAPDMRMRWFVRDEGMNEYRLKGHADAEFFGWIGSWASVLRHPRDVGFDCDGYDLPALNIVERVIATPKKENGKLFNDSAVNATGFHAELRVTLAPRMEAVAEMVNASTEPFIVWVEQDIESEKICKIIPDAVEVRGSQKPELKELRLLGFAKGEFRVLVTKKKIAQFGLNYQHCRNQVFASLDFSFEGLYQAIRRSYRFGQKNEVNIVVVSTDTMENVIETIRRKQRMFDEMMMKTVIYANPKEHKMTESYERREVVTPLYTIINGDSCEEMPNIPSNSMDFSVFSPPFSTLFTYSDSVRDLGNCSTHEEFMQNLEFIYKELYRIMRPGRLVAVHTKDLARYKGTHGYSGMHDFTGDSHRLMEKVGFRYHCKIPIWTDPVLEMQRTKSHRLLYKNVTSDSSGSGVGMPEYVTVFRKWEGNEDEWVPISNKTKANFSLETWQALASPIWSSKLNNEPLGGSTTRDAIITELAKDAGIDIPAWMDIRRTDVLNGYEGATDAKDEKHICPLQLDVIERCVAFWSNKGETVFTPFLGIGSEVYKSVKMGRKGYGIELKPSYFDFAVGNCRASAQSLTQLSLFPI